MNILSFPEDLGMSTWKKAVQNGRVKGWAVVLGLRIDAFVFFVRPAAPRRTGRNNELAT